MLLPLKRAVSCGVAFFLMAGKRFSDNGNTGLHKNVVHIAYLPISHIDYASKLMQVVARVVSVIPGR